MQVVGFKTFLFGYTHFGGTNNLPPGRPESQSVTLGMPEGAKAFAAIARASLDVLGDKLTCGMRLTAETEDNSCLVHVRSNVLFIK